MDMCLGTDEPFTILATFIGTVEHRIMPLFEMRSLLHGHGATNDVVGVADLFFSKSKMPEHIEVECVEHLFADAQVLPAEGFAQNEFVKRKGNIEYLG